MANNKFFKLVMRQEKLVFLNAPINEMIGVSLGVALLWIGGLDVLESPSNTIELESKKFVRFIIFLFAMLQPVRKITGVASVMQVGMASAERVFSILDVNSDTVENKNPITAEQMIHDIKSAPFKKYTFLISHHRKVYFLKGCTFQ